jgi:nitroreductase
MDGDFPAHADFAALNRLLTNRHSCRAFLAKPVPRELIERILQTAGRAASWCNSQPWQVEVTSGEATESFRQAIYAHVASGEHSAAYDYPAPLQYAGKYLERRRGCGLALYQSLGISRDDKQAARLQGLENFNLFGAPHVAIITAPADLGAYGAIDCGAYIGMFLLAAESLGIGAIAQAALAAYPDFIRAHFGLPEERRVVAGISFGYADKSHPANGFRTSRVPVAEMVTWHGAA